MRFLRFMSTRPGRVIRVGMGVAIIAAGVLAGGGLGLVLMLVGLLPIVTGAAGVCPISPLVGEPFRACSTSTARPKT
jgi:hypothetical protein